MKKKVFIIGSGFSSLSAACYLAKYGFDVSVFEKNDSFGGRARQFKMNGYTFDMGPSWYWMPDVFERFFNDFDKKSAELYKIKKLDPGYKVFFKNNQSVSISSDVNKIIETFENIEKGSGNKLKKFLKEAKDNYELAVKDMLYKMPGFSILELINFRTILKFKLFLTNINKQVNSIFKNEMLRSILKFPVLFLGAKPNNTPAFYNFMNYADFGLGTWQPKNGFYDVVKSMLSIAEEQGVKFYKNSTVNKINIDFGQVKSITVNNKELNCDFLVSGADYAHTENLMDIKYRQYSDNYWDNRVWSPSSLLFYIGIKKRLKNLNHHNLFFDSSFEKHSDEIYTHPSWPENPLFYVNLTSKTFEHTAPKGHENCFILIPIATNLNDTDDTREKYFNMVLDRMEKLTNQKIRDYIDFKRSYCIKDFKDDYNSFGGNAYGLANTLLQTALLRPKLKSKKVKKLYFSGQLTVPGPGVPPAIVSGKLVAKIIKNEGII